MKVLDLFSGTGSSTQAFSDRGHDVKRLDITDDYGPVDFKVDVLEFAEDPDKYLKGWRPDFVWASPPCQAFSMSGSGQGKKRWETLAVPDVKYGPRRPLTPFAVESCEWVIAARSIGERYAPNAFLLENPNGGLRTMRMVEGLRVWTITYCKYGETRQKKTDLFGQMPEGFAPRPVCRGHARHGVIDQFGNEYRVEQVGAGKSKTFILHKPTGESRPVPRDGIVSWNGSGLTLKVMDEYGNACHEWAARGFRTGTQGIDGAENRARLPLEFSQELCEYLEANLQINGGSGGLHG